MAECFKFKNYNSSIAISCDFIDFYVPEANPAFVVVYLFALRTATAGISCDLAYFADKLAMLESDVKRAFDYWERKKVIKIDNDEIVFLPINENEKNEMENAVEEDFESAVSLENEIENPVKLELFPNYTNEDVDKLINNDGEFKQIMKIAEAFYGRPMQSSERDLFLGMYYSAGLPLEVIAVLCTYCNENNKKNRRYIESVVNDWYERGIDTSEKAEEYISNFKNIYRPVIRAYGVTNREATKNEMVKIDRWIKEYGASIELIKYACSKTIDNTGKVSFAYTDKILKEWNKNGIKTVLDVEKYEKEFADKASQKKEKKKEIKVVKATQFNNFEQRDYDPEKLKVLQSQILNDFLNDEGGNE